MFLYFLPDSVPLLTYCSSILDIGYLFSSDSWFAWNAEKEFARLTALDRITDAEKVPVDIEEDLKEGKGTISQTESATESEASISLVA